jgi:ACR3 family arsenite transporter
VGLIATVVLLFGFQAGTIVEKPAVIAMIAMPLIIANLRHFLHRLVGRKAAEAAARTFSSCGWPCLPDWHLQSSLRKGLAVAVAISLVWPQLWAPPTGHRGRACWWKCL